jgi:hypothetical protein
VCRINNGNLSKAKSGILNFLHAAISTVCACRMIIGNLMTYGLRMQVNRALLQSVLPLPLSWDDGTTLAAIPGSCILFALGALLIEWVGLSLLLAQEKVRGGGRDFATVGFCTLLVGKNSSCRVRP